MMTDRASDSGTGDTMLACHVTNDATCDSAFAATCIGGSGDKRKDDRSKGKFQFRVHDKILHVFGQSRSKVTVRPCQEPYAREHISIL